MCVLAATGLICGRKPLRASPCRRVAAAGTDTPLAVVGDSFKTPGIVIGCCCSPAGIAVLYRSARDLPDHLSLATKR